MNKCYRCNKEIFFNDKWIGKRGKHIPLDKTVDGYKKHDCPYKQTRKQWAREKSFYGHAGMPFVRVEE